MILNELRKNFIKRIRHVNTKNNFIQLNDTFSYGRSGNVLHIHLVPKDLRNKKEQLGEEKFNEFIQIKLEDFLSKSQPIVKDDNSISGIFAVSPIFYHDSWKNIFESVGFDSIKEIKLNDNTSNMPYEQRLKFLNMFNNDGKYSKKVFYTNLSREKLLNSQYHRLEDINLNKTKY